MSIDKHDALERRLQEVVDALKKKPDMVLVITDDDSQECELPIDSYWLFETSEFYRTREENRDSMKVEEQGRLTIPEEVCNDVRAASAVVLAICCRFNLCGSETANGAIGALKLARYLGLDEAVFKHLHPIVYGPYGQRTLLDINGKAVDLKDIWLGADQDGTNPKLHILAPDSTCIVKLTQQTLKQFLDAVLDAFVLHYTEEDFAW